VDNNVILGNSCPNSRRSVVGRLLAIPFYIYLYLFKILSGNKTRYACAKDVKLVVLPITPSKGTSKLGYNITTENIMAIEV